MDTERTADPAATAASRAGAGSPLIALVGFVLLTAWRAPPLVVVAFSAVAGIGAAML